MGMTAIVLAGDREASKDVLGQNKAFLDIDGRPILYHVLQAMDQARQVAHIFVVGPKSRLEEHIHHWPFQKPVVVLEQQANIYENGWMAFLHSFPDYHPERPETEYEEKYRDSAVLIATCDIPLLVSAEVDHFILHADLTRYDMIYGVTPEEAMQRFYPTPSTPGIRMAYFYMREHVVRQSNFIIIKPFRVKNREYIRKMYSLRYQKSIRNVFRLAWTLLTVPEGSLGIIWDYFALQVNMQLARTPLRSLTRLTRRMTSIERLCQQFGRLLGTRFGYVLNPLGGAALDADNEQDYHTMRQMFAHWKREQESLGERLELPKLA